MNTELSPKSVELNVHFSKYFQKFIVLVVIWISILTIWLWVRALYFKDDLLKIWSFTLEDIPWTPPPTVPTPIIAGHYFGDFQLPILLSQVKNPYDASWPLGGGPPLSYFLYKPFLIPEIKLSFIFFLFITIVIFYFVNNLFVGRQINCTFRICFITLAIFVNLPFLVTLDRGNFVVISTSLTGLCLYYLFLREGNELWYRRHAIPIVFVIAISIKVYLLSFLIPLWLLKKYGFVMRTLIYFIFLNFVSYFLINPNIDDVFQSFRFTFGGQAGFGNPLFLFSGVGLPSFFSNLIRFLTSFEYSSTILSENVYFFLLPILIWYSLVLFFISRKELRIELKLIWILSLIQFAPPVAMAYNMVWNVLALMILVRYVSKARDSKVGFNDKSAMFLFFPIFFSLTFFPWSWWRLISPGMWIVAALVQAFLIIQNSVKSNRMKEFLH